MPPRTATVAAAGEKRQLSGGAASLTDAHRVEVRARLAALARPNVAWAEDIWTWWESLPPARSRYVARLLTAEEPRRPVRHLSAPGLDESAAEAIARYGISVGGPHG